RQDLLMASPLRHHRAVGVSLFCPEAEADMDRMETNIWFWVLFNAFVLVLLALDLGVFHREAHVVSVKEAAIWSLVWISLAMIFNAGIYLYAGSEPALEFLTGYLIEKSLSVDNIFVFVLLFAYFNVPAA